MFFLLISNVFFLFQFLNFNFPFTFFFFIEYLFLFILKFYKLKLPFILCLFIIHLFYLSYFFRCFLLYITHLSCAQSSRLHPFPTRSPSLVDESQRYWCFYGSRQRSPYPGSLGVIRPGGGGELGGGVKNTLFPMLFP